MKLCLSPAVDLRRSLIDTLHSRRHLCGARAGESSEVRSSAFIPERIRKFVRNAGKL